jgi:transcriptional regulator with XRE-family HTH domain
MRSQNEVIAHNMKVLRDLRGLGQQELADGVRVSRRTIARIEAGQIGDPGFTQVKRLAAYLGVSVDLFTEEPLSLVSVPVPARLDGLLKGARAPQMLDALVKAATSHDRAEISESRERVATQSTLREPG